VTVLAWILAPLLLAGAASFLVETRDLTATLFVSLPLLLVVVGGMGTAASSIGWTSPPP
jgi:hypothetical protein